MSKRRPSNREQLRKMLSEAEPSSLLKAELTLVQATIEQRSEQTVPRFIKLLKLVTEQAPKHFIAHALGLSNDKRAIRPLIRAARAIENEGYRANFLWPLENYDCTKHLDFFVNFMLNRDDPGEAMLACGYVIAAMNGPFDAQKVKRNIRKLLAAKSIQDEPAMQLQAEHFRMGAADYLMSAYFLQIGRQYHKKPAIN
jgi:hypothetical protein